MWAVARLLLTATIRPWSGPVRPAPCRCPAMCSLPPCRRTTSDRRTAMSVQNQAEPTATASERRAGTAAAPPVTPEKTKKEGRPLNDRATSKQESRSKGGQYKNSLANPPPQKSPKKKNQNEKPPRMVPLAKPALRNLPKHQTQSERNPLPASQEKHSSWNRTKPGHQHDRNAPTKSLQRNSPKQLGQTGVKPAPRNSPRRKRQSFEPSSGKMSGGAAQVPETVDKGSQEDQRPDVELLAVKTGAENKAAGETVDKSSQGDERPDIELVAVITGAENKAAGPGQQKADRGDQQPTQQNVLATSQHQDADQRKPKPPQVSGEEMLKQVRVWEPVTSRYQAPGQLNGCGGDEFTMVSYNVLSQHLYELHPELYVGGRPEDAAWPVRGPRLWDQLLGLRPDVVCLQEVEERDIESFWRPRCNQAGFNIVYKKRTGNDKKDGCAVLFRESVFSLIELATVEYHQPDCKALDRDNVGIVLRLRGAAGDLVVACTHLLYNPKRHDVKLAQLALLLAEVDRLAWCGRRRAHVPVLLAGDLNLKPHSPVYQFLRGGRLEYGGMSRRVLTPFGSGERLLTPLIPPELGVTPFCRHAAVQLRRHHHRQPAETEAERRRAERQLLAVRHSGRRQPPPPLPLQQLAQEAAACFLAHDLRLGSVYTHRTNRGPEATTCQRQWVTVDYIFQSMVAAPGGVRLELTSRLALPTDKLCERLGPCPSAALPSDHLPLAARFRMVPPAAAPAAWWPAYQGWGPIPPPGTGIHQF